MTQVYIICGPPGAGKTTYGKKLAAGRDPNDRDSPWFKTHFREPIYDTLFAIAKENLPVQDVIITGPFTQEIKISNWPDQLAQRLGSPVKIHYVTCSPMVRQERIIARGEARDLAKLEDWDSHQAYFGKEEPPIFEHTLIQTN